MLQPPATRAASAIFKDARSALVALVVVGAVGGGLAVLNHHVRMRAWVAVVIAAAVLVTIVVLDTLRYRAVRRATRVEGALEEARASAPRADTERKPSPPAQEVLRLIRALKGTLNRRAEPYTVAERVGATEDELVRLRDLVDRVRTLLAPLDEQTAALLMHFAQSAQGPTNVANLLSGLDHMEAQVINWGLEHEHAASPNAARLRIQSGRE